MISSATTATTAADAVREEEITRTRLFLQVGVLLATVAFFTEWVTGGDPTTKAISMSALAAVAIATGILARLLRDPGRNSDHHVVAAALSVTVGAIATIYYWGVFSPAPTSLLLAINAFSQNTSRSGTTALYALIASIHALVAASVLGGIVPDRGVITGAGLPLKEQIIIQVLLQCLYACAFMVSRLSRKAMVAAVERLEQTTRALAARETLLHEARMDLERALQVGGPGRYTDQIVGSFRLGSVIGRGGMGEVYEATNVRDGTEAAVKLLNAHGMGDRERLRRFLREAELAAQLDCEHVVRVLEVGGASEGIPFLAMERLRGHDLAEHLRHHGRKMDLAQVVVMIRELARGLEAARVLGIIHRDLKPHNVFLAHDPDSRRTWKILDFGVSKQIGEAGSLTQGAIVGTPSYMAPEQARGDEVDARADVYSLAAIAYRALTGHPPATGKDFTSSLYEAIHKVPTRPSVLAGVPDPVEEVLALGLAKQPSERFTTATELAEALAAAADDQLPPALRARARRHIAAYGWGSLLQGA